MAQLRVDTRRKTSLELRDPFRNLTQTLRVAGRLSPALFVSNDGQAFAKRGGEIG
jgi:hypothetical protein